jgi:hypothetical protein
MPVRRFTSVAVAALALCALTITTPASAAEAPPNDTVEGAIALTIGQTVTEDTSAADAGDPIDFQVTFDCWGANGTTSPQPGKVVWYSFTPSSTGRYQLDTTQSSYFGSTAVLDDTLSISSMRCGLQDQQFDATAGQKLYIAAYAGNGDGGTLVLGLKSMPEPTMSVRVDSTGRVAGTGLVSMSGSYVCRDATNLTLSGTLSQKAGRAILTATFNTSPTLLCDDKAHAFAWTAKGSGKFAGGKVDVVASWTGGTWWRVLSGSIRQTVQLRG